MVSRQWQQLVNEADARNAIAQQQANIHMQVLLARLDRQFYAILNGQKAAEKRIIDEVKQCPEM